MSSLIFTMNDFKLHINIPYIDAENFEAEIYSFKDGKGNPVYALSHDTLEKLQRDYLNNVSFALNVLSASEKYAAVQVTLSNVYGRTVSEVADVSTMNLDSSENKTYLKAHPLVAAKINAFDACVRKFLDLPRIFNPNDYPELKDQIEAMELEKAMAEAEKLAAEESQVSDDVNDSIAETTELDSNESNENEETDSILDSNPYANEVFHAGKYKGQTCREVWKTDRNYFDRVKKWKGYEYAVEFANWMTDHEEENHG